MFLSFYDKVEKRYQRMDICSQLAEGQAKYTARLKSTTAPQITDSAVSRGAKRFQMGHG